MGEHVRITKKRVTINDDVKASELATLLCEELGLDKNVISEIAIIAGLYGDYIEYVEVCIEDSMDSDVPLIHSETT